jgi:hypothetical protein
MCALDYCRRWARCKWRLSWATVSGRGPICLFLAISLPVYHPLTCRPLRRPTRRRSACPGGQLSIPVIWVTWWPHLRAGPAAWIKYFFDNPPFFTRAETVPPLAAGPRFIWGHLSAFAGEKTANMCVKYATSMAHVRVRGGQWWLSHVTGDTAGRGPAVAGA